MTEADVYAALTDIFRDCFNDTTLALNRTTSAQDVAGWDSAKMVYLVLAVEDRFGIRMRSREIDALRCVGDWVRLILSRVPQGSGEEGEKTG
jgi:acyl carrier protein